MFINFKFLTEEKKLISEKLKNFFDVKKELEVLKDLLSLQKEKISDLKKSELELSYFKNENNFEGMNSVILNNQIVEKNKYLLEINENLENKRKILQNDFDLLKIEKNDLLTKYKILKNSRKKSRARLSKKNLENGNTQNLELHYQMELLEQELKILASSKENSEKKVKSLKKENEVLEITKVVYMEKIEELVSKMKIIDENHFFNITKNNNKMMSIQNENEELKKKIYILTENENLDTTGYLKKSICSKITDTTESKIRSNTILDEKLKENLILQRELLFSGNEIKKYQNYILELKQKNMKFRNRYEDLKIKYGEVFSKMNKSNKRKKKRREK